jgi:endogenous inhibitor of DNA gyrase (YacG/DUF329 family)
VSATREKPGGAGDKRKPRPHRACPICSNPAAEATYPFCSRRCSDLDLHRWLSDVYAIPVADDETEAKDGDEPQ